MLKAGMCRKIMTPPSRTLVAGLMRQRISTYVESEICVNVCAAEVGGGQMIIASMDLVGFDQEFSDTVKAEVLKRTDSIDTEKIILCVTHTHSAPTVSSNMESRPFCIAEDLPEGKVFENDEVLPEDVWGYEKNRAYMTPIIAEAICEAWENREEGYFAHGFGRASVGHCRRLAYTDGTSRMYGFADEITFDCVEGGEDSGIELLYFFNKGKKPMGVIASVACPAQVNEANYFISSDFWGKVRDFTEAEIDKDFVTVGVCGAAGDQSPRDLIRNKRADFEAKDDPRRQHHRGGAYMYDVPGTVEIGHKITDIIKEGIKSAELREDAVFKYKIIDLPLPVRAVTLQSYEASLKRFNDYVAARERFNVQNLWELYADWLVIKRYKLQKEHATLSHALHIIRFDDMAFATNPFELYLDFGNRIKARSFAAQTFLIQLACKRGDEGYLSTKKADEGMSYGSLATSGIADYNGGDLLVNATVEAINEMF